MTIEERRRREKRDRENPWRHISQIHLEPEGAVFNVRVKVSGGVRDMDDAIFFLHGRNFVRIDKPWPLSRDAVEYRPTGATISKERRETIIYHRRRKGLLFPERYL